MRRLMLIPIVLFLMIPAVLSDGKEEARKVAKSWIGQPREAVVERWGQPVATKDSRDGGEILMYELSIPLGQFGYDDSSDLELEIEKDEEGKRRLVDKTVRHTETVYKTVKIKFHIDPNGSVKKAVIPAKAGMYAIPAPEPTGKE